MELRQEKIPEYDQAQFTVSTDIVIFTIRAQQLSVLLVSDATQDAWILPGGILRQEESLRQCASRELEEKTGVSGVYLEQLYTFGEINDSAERIIRVAYYTLIPSEKIHLKAATDTLRVDWFAMNKLPTLATEVRKIIAKAKQRLIAKLDYSTIAFQFMQPEFTLSELQTVYESILEERVDKRNFRKRVLSLESIKETGEVQRNGRHRPAKLYRLVDPNKVEIIK